MNKSTINNIQHINIINSVDDGKRPTIVSEVNGKEIRWLMDTGASHTLIDSSHNLDWDKFHRTPNEIQELVGADGTPFPVICTVIMPIKLAGKIFHHRVIVVENLVARAIIGTDLIKHAKCDIRLWKGPEQRITFAHEWNTSDTVNCLENGTSTVKIKESITIPAGYQAKVSLMTGLKETEGIATCNNCEFVDCAVKSGRYGEFQGVVNNNSTRDIEYRRGQVVGIFEEIFQNSHLAADIHAIVGDPVMAKKTKRPNPISAKKKAYLQQEINLSHLNNHEKQEVWTLIEMFHDIFSDSDHDLGKTSAIRHEINLKHNNPIHISQFTLPWEHRTIVEDYVKELLAKKCVRPSLSPYNAPIFCVKKPHGNGWRIVCDYRQLNLATKEDKYVIRSIKSCIDEIGKKHSKIFSALDLTHGFWQLALDERSSPLTAFTVPGWGRFEWTSTPMGLNGSPSTFARLMDWVMTGLENILTYIDDVLCHSRNFKEHMVHLKEAFKRLEQFGLKLKPRKCLFAKRSVPYLGYTVSDEGVSPSTEKTQAIKDFPEPRNQKSVREFIGLCNYFRGMIPNFSIHAGKLSNLLRSTSVWQDGPLPEDARKAFLHLQTALTSSPILAYPQPGVRFHLATDACTGDANNNGGFGAVLSQFQDGQEKVIAYASRTMKKHEKNYSAFLAESAAACFGIDAFSVYLTGRKFTLYSDHRPLERVSTKHEKTLKRLQQQMLDYNFTIQYRKGEANKVADALSRNTQADPPDIQMINFLENQYIPPEELYMLQQHDEFCRNIYQAHLEGSNRIAKQLFDNTKVWHDVVVINIPIANRAEAPDGFHTVVVAPRSMHTDIMRGCHNSPMGGHVGITKTLDAIQQTFWWPNMREDVTRWIANCMTCQEVKDPVHWHAHRQPMKEMPVCDAPNQRVHIDLFGPLKTNDAGKKYVMVMADAFSKYVVLHAIANKEAVTVAKTLHEKWNLLFGPPRQITSDRGKEFDNKVVREMCDTFNIKRVLTSAFHPQSNGQAERFNRTMIKYLKAVLGKDDTLDWEAWLPSLAFSYNTQVQRATQMTPFFLTFKHEAKLPFDMDIPRSYSNNYLSNAMVRMKESYKAAKANIIKMSRKNKKDYDKTSRLDPPFQVGDRVLVHFLPNQTHGNAKLKRNWINGYTVMRCNGKDAYVLQHDESRKHLTTVNADRMKLERKEDIDLEDRDVMCRGKQNDHKNSGNKTAKSATKSAGSFELRDVEKQLRRVSRSQEAQSESKRNERKGRMEFSPFSLPAANDDSDEREEPIVDKLVEETMEPGQQDLVTERQVEPTWAEVTRRSLDTDEKSQADGRMPTSRGQSSWRESRRSEESNWDTSDGDKEAQEEEEPESEETKYLRARALYRAKKQEEEKIKKAKQDKLEKYIKKEGRQRKRLSRKERGLRSCLRDRWNLPGGTSSGEDEEEEMETTRPEYQKPSLAKRIAKVARAALQAEREVMAFLKSSSDKSRAEMSDLDASFKANCKVDPGPLTMKLRPRNAPPQVNRQKRKEFQGQRTCQGKKPRLDEDTESE